MTTIISIFVLSLVFALVLTPLVIRLAKKYDIVDRPSARKIHTAPIPRLGGVAIYLAFFLPFLSAFFYQTEAMARIGFGAEFFALAGGATAAFGLGLIDDLKRLRAHWKIAVQVIAAATAYAGGIKITFIDFGFGGIELGLLSFPVTVFWFLLFINALNLLDGLDGLSSGVAFFVSMILLILTVLQGNIGIALFMAALGGATLGFLFYNFYPASIFMGDSGSYFLGFCLAALSIAGSIKTNTAVAILIPVIAMGVPVMDTIFAPIRRFLLGRKMFSPDGEHLHHRLIQMGLSHKLAVMTLYGVTIALGAVAFLMAHARDERAALILLVVGAVAIVSIRKLGYLDFIRGENFTYWLKSLSYEAGLPRERRSFVSLQAEIHQARDVAELWEKLCRAFEYLHFDMAELVVESNGDTGAGKTRLIWERNGDGSRQNGLDDFLRKQSLLKLELPLSDDKNGTSGRLWLVKDLERDPLGHYTLRRVEHLRRVVARAVEKMG